MNLLQVRETFVKRSGRFDLVTDTTGWTDNGANFFINAAQKHLDGLTIDKKRFASTYVEVEQGQISATFQRCRAIRDVWLLYVDSSGDDARTELEKIDYDALRKEYGKPFGDVDEGTPLYFHPANLRLHPEDADMTDIPAKMKYIEQMLIPGHDYNGVIIAPPPDQDVVLEVFGKFFSHELSEDTDESFWSVVHEFLLVIAAMRQVEVFNRNSEGVKDWDAAIAAELRGIDFDTVEEEIAQMDQMEG